MGPSDDFNHAPWQYPGTPVERSDPAEPTGCDDRAVVLAVGSNRSRAVLDRKFGRRGLSATMPLIRCRVRGLRVGHSAHVSAPGYIPAAPIADPDADNALVASLVDADELAVLDATEPNYRRCVLDGRRFRLELDGGARPASFFVYRSRHGVLGSPGGPAWALFSQDELFERLTAECPGFAGLGEGNGRSMMRSFANRAELRETARSLFRHAGWAGPDGFDPVPADHPMTAEVVSGLPSKASDD